MEENERAASGTHTHTDTDTHTNKTKKDLLPLRCLESIKTSNLVDNKVLRGVLRCARTENERPSTMRQIQLSYLLRR